MKHEVVDANFIDITINALARELPPIFARREVPKLLGGSIASGTLANLGKDGPPYIKRGRNAIYEKSTFLKWLKEWLNPSTS